MKEMGNPFQEESADLLALDTNTIADPALAAMVGTHIQRGKEQFESFLEGMQNDGELYLPIKKNKVSFFKHEQAANSSKEKVLKDDSCSHVCSSPVRRQCDLP